jgi:hypothetical protein
LKHSDFLENRILLFDPMLSLVLLEGKACGAPRFTATPGCCLKFPVAKKKARHEALQLNASDPFSGIRRQRDNRA